MATAKGYTDDDRKRIVSAMQSMCDRLGGFLVRTYGDQFDGDIDTMLDAINFMKALRFEKPAALAEPLFLLHTGAVYGNERGDWEIEANSGKAVDAYCDANPGKTVGLYLATPAQQPAAAVQKGWKEAAIAWEVCASIHRKYGKGKDALFSTRQKDFMAGAEKARAMLAAAERKGE